MLQNNTRCCVLSSPAAKEPTALQRLVDGVCSPELVAGGVDDHCVRCGAEYFVQHVRHWNDLAQAKVFTVFLRRYGAEGGHAKTRCPVFVNSTLCVNGKHFVLRALAQHSGPCGAAGHYTAWVPRDGGHIVYDDGQVWLYRRQRLRAWVEETAVLFMAEEVASLLSPCEVLPTVLAAIGSCRLPAEAAQYRATHRGLNELTSEEVAAATPEAIQASPPSSDHKTAYDEVEKMLWTWMWATPASDPW